MDLDVTKSKFFQFNFTLEGIDYRSLSGKLEFIYENVIYAFPTKIHKNSVEVEIPALQSVIKKHIMESDDLVANLEIIGETFHLPAWKSEINIKRSLFIEGEEPKFDDSILSSDKSVDQPTSNNLNILEEDVEFLRKLKNDMSQDDFHFEDKTLKESVSPEKSTRRRKPKTAPKKTKKVSFDKRAFLKEASEQEKYAVENGIPLSETAKNDTPEEKDFRIKIRDIVQEDYTEKLKAVKSVKKSKVPEKLVEQSEMVAAANVFDVDSINESNVNAKSIRMMMESVGMTTDKTQNRMIENAKDKGAKTDIQIFDDIKGLLFPTNNNDGNQLQESYQKAYEVFQRSNN